MVLFIKTNDISGVLRLLNELNQQYKVDGKKIFVVNNTARKNYSIAKLLKRKFPDIFVSFTIP